MSTASVVECSDLKALHASLADGLAAAATRVLQSGWFILGPEVEAFEREFAAWHGLEHAVGVANGTDAIALALRAAGIGPGDEVITVAHTAVATVCAVERTGARPVLVDIDPRTFTMDPAAAAAAITPRTRAIVPVHLYGHPADMDALLALKKQHGLFLLEDCAQAHGAEFRGRRVGTMGDAASFSFYPTKNLGALGDGGAIITRDAALAARLKRIRNYGQVVRYRHQERGVNSRLDELQAALLRVKLPHLQAHNDARRAVASRYQVLRGVQLPVEAPECRHVYHLYAVRHPRRDALMTALREHGVGTLIHYPVPVHLQEAYADLGLRAGSLPHTEGAANEVLSLPMYVGVTETQVNHVITTLTQLAERT